MKLKFEPRYLGSYTESKIVRPARLQQAQFFAGQLVFKDESLLTRFLHNHTVFELQRRLYQNGWPMLILPIQV